MPAEPTPPNPPPTPPTPAMWDIGAACIGGDRGIDLAAPAPPAAEAEAEAAPTAVCCVGAPCIGELSNMPSKSSGWMNDVETREGDGA